MHFCITYQADNSLNHTDIVLGYKKAQIPSNPLFSFED